MKLIGMPVKRRLPASKIREKHLNILHMSSLEAIDVQYIPEIGKPVLELSLRSISYGDLE